MLEVAHAAFGDNLLVKLHPVSDAARIKDILGPRLKYSDEPIAHLLNNARALIYSYSVVPYEALFAAVPPIHFRSPSRLDLDQLDPTPDLRWVGSTADQLKSALAEAEVCASDPEWQSRARATVLAALTPPSPGCAGAFLGG